MSIGSEITSAIVDSLADSAADSAPLENAGLQAWIDVGGTFTDCYVTDTRMRRLGMYRRIKILSSGMVPISRSIANSSADSSNLLQADSAGEETFQAPELSADTDGFWRGARLRMFDAQQALLGSVEVLDFSSSHGTLHLKQPIATDAHSFELDAGLEAPVLAVRRLIGCPLLQPLPALSVRLGTTRGTNALLTRSGAKVAFAITASLEDLMLIGDQTRPRLFDLAIQRNDQLTCKTIPVHQRMDAAGQTLVELDEAKAREALKAALADGCESLAICLLHSYRNGDHEQRLEAIAREVGYRYISRSSVLAPLIEMVARARTTIVDAYLSPIIRSYLSLLAKQFGDEGQGSLQIMTSAGGLVDWRAMAGKDSILSGPAGGVVALKALSRATAFPQLIGLDMGGTSTDACRTAPDQSLEYESTKAGVRILTPTLPIETVASGGGSICWFDGVSLRVGPQSAGALPGPACYGRGGPLTITDLNVFLGRIPPEQFPFPLDRTATERRLAELWEQVVAGGLKFDSREQLADGLRTIANQQMAEAVRTITIAQGSDPRNHALVGFGGAAGQHICEIAELLSIHQIIDTPEAGLLSALGMGLASERLDRATPLYQPIEQIDWDSLWHTATTSVNEMLKQWSSQRGSDSHSLTSSAALELRYVGTDTSLPIAWREELHEPDSVRPGLTESTTRELRDRFTAEHRKRFGYARPSREIEAVSLRVDVTRHSGTELPTVEWRSVESSQALEPITSTQLYFDGAWHTAIVCARDRLAEGSLLTGPAVVLSAGSTLIIAPDWRARASANSTLLLERVKVDSPTDSSNGDSKTQSNNSFGNAANDAVAEAVFAQRLAAVATQMGVVLQQTALSVNVKQRRDFSCAVFDEQGRMLASAPHVPVHLGAMGTTVRAAMRLYPDLGPGEVVITNDPYSGGSHLPDVTIISGVYAGDDKRPKLFVANRAHHADIGGMAPGSMSVTANRLGDEGVIISPMRLRAEQCDELEPLRTLFEQSPWPPRNIAENLADLRAQLAANARGIELLLELAGAFGWSSVAHLTQAVLAMAEQKVRGFIRALPETPLTFRDSLDDGTAISVAIAPHSDRLVIDFEGTGPTSTANFNANPSIVSAAIIYVLRCLIADELPLNEGMLSLIDLRIPDGVLNPKVAAKIEDSPAVAAGNVETSQRVVDVLLGAFHAAAASQGTMNNLLFGNSRFGFYETICGGAGATRDCNGASGVHTHMTNTRLTDPEVLEARYPARLVQFAVRRGSGGAGRMHGGDGVIRAIQFLETVSVSLLTSRRGSFQPYGLEGGMPGQPGLNVRVDLQGKRTHLPSACFLQFNAGEIIEIHTPGGGGFGSLPDESSR